MSKYIKLEDAMRAIDNAFDSIPMEQTIEILQVRRTIRNLPTIEVSEDVIGQGSGDIDWQAVTSTGQEIYAKGYEDGKKSVEVSEDAISREWAINQQRKRIDLLESHKTVERREQVYWQIGERELVAKELENAPSVLPKRSCYRCGLREDCEDSTERKPKEGEWMPRV